MSMRGILAVPSRLLLLLLPVGPPLDAQTASQPDPAPACTPDLRCMTVSFRDAELSDVVAAFAEFSGYSIVLGTGIGGRVTAEIRNQRWDVALQAILQAHGLAARETYEGIIRVDALERLREREVQEPLVTRVFRINYAPVRELAASLSALASPRGSVTAHPSTNMLVVTDTESAVARMAVLLGQAP